MLRGKYIWTFLLCCILPLVGFAQEPTVQISNLSSSSITCNSALLQWTNGNGDRRIIIVREANPTDKTPTDAANYSSSTLFGSGQHLGNGNYVVFVGSVSLINITGLKNNTTYYVSAFDFNNNAGTPDYLSTAPATTSFTTYGISLSYTKKAIDSCWNNNSYQLTNTSNSNFPSTTYKWVFGDGTTSTTTSPSKSYANGGQYNIYLTVFPNYGCKDTVFGKITAIPKPTIDIGIKLNDTSQCLRGNKFDIQNNTIFSSINGLGLIRTWDFGDGTFDNTFQPTKFYDSAKKYRIKNYIEMTFNNAPTGCKDTGFINIETYPNPSGEIKVTDTINCIGKNTISFANNTPNTITYDWNFGDGNTASGQTVTHDYIAPGNYQVIHSASSIYGCNSKDTIKIIARKKTSAYFSPVNSPFCLSNTPVPLLPDETKGVFLGNNVSGTNYIPNKLGADTIIYITKDSFCADTSSRIVSVQAAPQPNLGIDQNLCNTSSVTLSEGIAGAYTWSDASTNPTLDVTQTGTYWLDVFDGTCTGRDSINIYFGLPPVLPSINDTFICKNSLLKFNFSNFDTRYLWNDGSKDSFKTITNGGFYTVTASNPCGTTTSSFNITQLTEDCNVMIPNAFSPNGDGRNDVFKPVLLSEDIVVTKFLIFDNYGTILFQSSKNNITWDGKYLGKLVPGNTNYHYLLYYFLPIKDNNQKGELKGSVFLIQ